LNEEAGIEAPRAGSVPHLRDPERDPRGNIVTVVYLAVTPDVGDLAAGTDAADAQLQPVAEVIDGPLPLAFDHQRIVDDAVRYAGERLEVGDLATAFVGPTFTLTDLKSVYEAVWGDQLDAANFRRSLATQTAEPYVEPTGRRSVPGPEGGRPPELFRTVGDWSKPPVQRPGSDRARSRRDRADPAASAQGEEQTDGGNHRRLTGEEPGAERAQEFGAQRRVLGAQLFKLGIEAGLMLVEPGIEAGLELLEVASCRNIAPASGWHAHHRGGPLGAHILFEPGEQSVAFMFADGHRRPRYSADRGRRRRRAGDGLWGESLNAERRLWSGSAGDSVQWPPSFGALEAASFWAERSAHRAPGMERLGR
jgi:8-oxo-dGTP diphosphatase